MRMLELNNISSGYGKKQVLFNINLVINKGETVLLSGGNGSGKSTLLKCIYNLLPCWSGDISIDGHPSNGLKPSELVKKGVVYIPQKDFYFENLTVDENIRISGQMLTKDELAKRKARVYELTGLHKFRNRKPFNLSGGERKILAFGMGLVHASRLFLFDEPFAGVDAKNSSLLLRLFKETIITPENCVIIVEHKDNAKQLFSRTVRMELGTIKNQ